MRQSADTPASRRVGSLWATVRAVASAFIGVRKRQDLERDGAQLNPLHIVVVGFAAVFVFVIALMGLVNWVVAK